jgi:hypothetical protein
MLQIPRLWPPQLLPTTLTLKLTFNPVVRLNSSVRPDKKTGLERVRLKAWLKQTKSTSLSVKALTELIEFFIKRALR